MTNAVIGTLAQDNTNYNLVQSVKELTKDILHGQELVMMLKKYGAINTDADQVVGDTANFYNLNRVDSNGLSESADVYSNADDAVYGQRQLIMDAVNYSRKVAKKNTMTQIRAETSIGDLTNGQRDVMIQWGRANILASVINQLAGNTQTSINRYELSSSAFTGSTLTHVTGLNSVTAVTSGYTFYGNNNQGSPANPSAITASNYASLVDYMNIASTIFDVNDSQSIWSPFDSGKDCRALVFIARSNWDQMMLQAPAAGTYANLAFERYQQLAANGGEKSRATGETVMGYKCYESIFTPEFKYVVVDDYILPRATHSNAEVANTRVSVVVGKNALDMKVGSMYPGLDNNNAAFNIRYDDTHEKLNNFDYYKLEMKYGCKRTLIKGTGANASTDYDNAVALLNLYSPK